MSVLKEFQYSEIDFEVYSSKQFATVVFDRIEDSHISTITVIQYGKVSQYEDCNRYNPSDRRTSTCVYVSEEWEEGKVVKICTIQHKGETLVQVHSVTDEEIKYFRLKVPY